MLDPVNHKELYQGYIKSQKKEKKARQNTPFISRRVTFEENLEENEVECNRKAEIRKTKFPEMGEDCKAVFRRTPDFKERTFESSVFSKED